MSYRFRWLAVCLGGVVALSGCRQAAQDDTAKKQNAASAAEVAAHATVTSGPFGALPDGTNIQLFTLTNVAGMQVRVINYGGVVTSIRVPDRTGKLDDVVLGYDTMEGYVQNPPHFGALIGRYANRIGKAQFTLDGKTYHLPANNHGNTLHGGNHGFDKVVWQTETFAKPGEAGLVLTRTSPDAEEGFPGKLSMRVTYTLTDDNALSFDYSATTDQPTVVNFTNHSYFNLAGEGSGDVLDHLLIIHADRYTPADETLIPLGELASVAGTPLDFRQLTPIGARIGSDAPLIRVPGGYDHNFVINREGVVNRESPALALAARVEEPKSGRAMEVRTTEPGVQLYTGNHLDGLVGKAGHIYNKYSAFCLETQHFPDSPNKSGFPSVTLRPGETFHSRTVYSFSVK